MTAKKILIAGGSGFLGKMLSDYFTSNGYDVAVLSREPNEKKNFFFWDPKKEEMEERAFEGVSYIINLGGASIAAKRWTRKRKQEITNSRILSTDFLYEKLRTIKHNVNTFISASGSGYYGNHKSEWLDETALPAGGFLSNCCRHWEESASKVSTLGIRTVIFRIGIVLSGKEGALPKLALPIKFFIASPMGSGKQFIPWIHYADLNALFLKAVEDNTMKGIYNVASPEPVTNRTFLKTLAHTLHRPVLLPPVPSFILKIILGEMATVLTDSQRTSAKKILDAGFHFQFLHLKDALENIYG